MRNEQLLRDVASHIEAHPEQYNQGTYGREAACGTTACIAGWACLLSGHEALVREMETLEVQHDELLRLPHGSWGEEHWKTIDRRDELAEKIHETGAKALGLEDEIEAGRLFSGGWRPGHGYSVPEALEKFAAGSSLEEISE